MTRPSTASTCLLAALLLGGCMEGNYAALQDEDGIPDEYLRLDVFPSELNAALLPESHFVDGWWQAGESLVLDLRTPIEVGGVVTEAAAPTDGVDEDRALPVQARVEAWVEGTVLGGNAFSDALTGRFSLTLPPSAAYAVAVVPEDGSGLPFQVLTDQDLTRSDDGWDVELIDGALLHGTVTDASGAPVAGMLVRPVHAATGVEGSSVQTGADGAWTLALAPDAYTLAFSMADGATVPTTRIDAQAEDGWDLAMDLALGPTDPVVATGRVMDGATHRPVEGAELRFRSRALLDHPQGSLEAAATTDADGAFSAPLLPGSWLVDVVPLAESGLTPVRESFAIGADGDGSGLGIVWIDPCVEVRATVRAPGGQPAAGVSVVASEDDVSGRTYTATTDATGALVMQVPAAPLHLVLTPADAAFAVTHLDVQGDAFPEALALGAGRLLSGRIVHEGQPVQAALVEVRDGQTDRLWARTITGDDGAFEIRLATDEDSLAPASDEDGEDALFVVAG